MMMAFTLFQTESNLCHEGTGWTVEMAKILKKILYVHDVECNIWLWYKHEQDLVYTCDQMSEEQIALPTFLPKTVRMKELISFKVITSKMMVSFTPPG